MSTETDLEHARARLVKVERDNQNLRATLWLFASRRSWGFSLSSGYVFKGGQPWRIATKALGWDETLQGSAAPGATLLEAEGLIEQMKERRRGEPQK